MRPHAIHCGCALHSSLLQFGNLNILQFADSCNISKPHAISILQFAHGGLYIVQLDDDPEGKTLQSFKGLRLQTSRTREFEGTCHFGG